MHKKNQIKVYTTSSGAELSISTPDIKQLISATNNRAQYFSELALKYRDEAKAYRDSAKYYAEQNSDVTFEYIDNIRAVLEEKISLKQTIGECLLKEELPQNVSAFNNDVNYISESELAVRLPLHEGNKNTYLYTDGEHVEWKKVTSGLEVCDIGMALFVDESKGLRRYLNGQIVDINTNTQAFLDRLKEITTLYPSLLCTEDEWQATKTLSAFGQVGKFVFNYSGDEVVSVRIPAIVNVQGLFDLSNLGMTVSAGLPNITGKFSGYLNSILSASGAFTFFNSGQGYDGGWRQSLQSGGGNYSGAFLNSSLSSSIYGNSNTVQPEAIQYPYFIQIATGAETENNIINDIELNNPYSLFDSKYSDHELNNLSWLKSEGQWNAKAVYPTAYDKLLKVYNGTETVEGLSVKLSTEDYTDYDFVLNTADETFRLPLLDGSEDLPSNRSDNLTLNASGSTYTAPANGYVLIRKFSNAIGQHLTGFHSSGVGDTKVSSIVSQALWVWFPVKRGENFGITYTVGGTTEMFRFIYAQGNGLLYYYVGETVQNANLIDAGRIGEQLVGKADIEQLANKVDLDAQNLSIAGKSLISGLGMPSNKYISLTLGASGTTYTAPANGWFFCEVVTSVAGGWLYATAKNFNMVSNAHGDGSSAIIFCPVLKGDSVRFSYPSLKDKALRFIYAEGSKEE